MSNMTTHGMVVLSLTCALSFAELASAQFGTPRQFGAPAAQLDQERTVRWKAGIRVTAPTGPCVGIYGYFSVPVDWPEQDVKVVEEEISDTVRRVGTRELEDRVKLMEFFTPSLAFREEAVVAVTFEVTRRIESPPADITTFMIPKSIARDVRKYLAPSPYIDSRDGRLRSLAKEITADHESAWQRVEAIYDWVKENIQHTSDPLRGATAAIVEKKGGHEDLAGVFIALCRAEKIPARIVWVPNYCYAEFYLEEESGEGKWFACEFKEKTSFATLSEPYIILQKGDNIEVPKSKTRKRFVPEHVSAKPGYPPKVSFIRQFVGMP